MGTRRGERRTQILEVLAQMLEEPTPEKITTAALAKRLDVSEAALYRHFASKAQMYEGLIGFIEETLFGLANKIVADEPNGLAQARSILAMLLGFAERNPGMVRVLIGEALVNENERLQLRVNQLLDRLEATLKQSLRVAATQEQESQGAGGAGAERAEVDSESGEGSTANETSPHQGGGATPLRRQSDAAAAQDAPDPAAHANVMIAFVIGRWHQYAKSGFRRKPTELWDRQWPLLV
jgi:TetR/AcrR family transcriptional regulator